MKRRLLERPPILVAIDDRRNSPDNISVHPEERTQSAGVPFAARMSLKRS